MLCRIRVAVLPHQGHFRFASSHINQLPVEAAPNDSFTKFRPTQVSFAPKHPRVALWCTPVRPPRDRHRLHPARQELQLTSNDAREQKEDQDT
jgi:hypothetical protein